jgi:deoxyadenosine/deoxycytidine kinase
MKKTLITIIGNVGSGKSTLASLLALELDLGKIDADNLFQTSNPFAKKYLSDKSRWAFANQTWMTYHRAKLLGEQLKKSGKEQVIVDSGLFMNWAYGVGDFMAGNLTEHEWELSKSIYELSYTGIQKHSQLVLSLRYPVSTLQKRIKKRGREYELVHYNDDYLGQLDKGLDNLEKKLSSEKIIFLKITERDSIDFENNPKELELIGKMVVDAVRKKT